MLSELDVWDVDSVGLDGLVIAEFGSRCRPNVCRIGLNGLATAALRT